MNKKQMDKILLGESSHVLLNAFMPPMTQVFHNNVVLRCNRNIAGLIQLREAMHAQQQAQEMAGEGQAVGG
jgi:hypothetical protein